MLMCLSQGCLLSSPSPLVHGWLPRSRPSASRSTSQPHASVIHGVYEGYWPGYHPIALLPYSGT